jgi:hypothetical protein
MGATLPLLPHLEGVGELLVRHPRLPPRRLSELRPSLLRRFALLLILLLLLSLEVEIGLRAKHLLRFDDCVVGTVLVGAEGRQLLVHYYYISYTSTAGWLAGVGGWGGVGVVLGQGR